MKTVDKALSVLDQFSLDHTEIGLSEIARMAGIDKAATRRLLVALAKHGFIEQSNETRKYRLGYGFLRLARIREATVPIKKAAQEVADWLVEKTNETAHVSVPGPQGMTTMAYRLPNRGHLVTIDPAELLFFHATASGLAYLSNASEETANKILSLNREKITTETVTNKSELAKALSRYRAQGYAQTSNSFETGVGSIGMAFWQDGEDPAGTISLALPDADLTEKRRDELVPILRKSVEIIERALTGQ